MNEWEDIETARGYRGPAIVHDRVKGVIVDAFLYGDDGFATYGYYNNTAHHVTHWMKWPDIPPMEMTE